MFANKAKPKLLVVYHTVSFPPGHAPPRFLSHKLVQTRCTLRPKFFKERLGLDSGKFVIGKDLDVL